MAESGTLTNVDQAELDNIIARHEAFRRGRSNGARAVLAHHDLSHLSFRGRDMSHADFTGSVLLETDFENAKLDFCLLYACDLRKANFRNASLVRADLRGSCLRGAVMTGADLSSADLREGSFAKFDPEKGLSFISEGEAWKGGTGGVDMRGANLGSVKLSGAIATNSNFQDANLSKSIIIKGNLSGANLTGANLAGADLSQCELRDVKLRDANLTGALIDFTGLVNVDLKGALTDKPMGLTTDQLPMTFDEMLKLHQVWLKSKGAEGQQLNLTGYDLRNAPSLVGANLTMLAGEKAIWYGLDLSQCNLQAAQLSGGDFRNCNFTSADLRGSAFRKCNMVSAKFMRARFEPLVLEGNRALKTSFAGSSLRYADFNQADVRDVDFSEADLSYANFLEAKIAGANFTNAKMHETKINRAHS
ncbi:MAG: pentapeptide repeat-containing protein [Alphaproteobacteria bacterium]|nr:pentapeptide repeat-containing protein [Alphaproteobacteria bacterium]